jgi:hypothetical protein
VECIIPLQIEPQLQAFEASKFNMGNGKEAGEKYWKVSWGYKVNFSK